MLVRLGSEIVLLEGSLQLHVMHCKATIYVGYSRNLSVLLFSTYQYHLLNPIPEVFFQLSFFFISRVLFKLADSALLFQLSHVVIITNLRVELRKLPSLKCLGKSLNSRRPSRCRFHASQSGIKLQDTNKRIYTNLLISSSSTAVHFHADRTS